jgi:hypothetical protein
MPPCLSGHNDLGRYRASFGEKRSDLIQYRAKGASEAKSPANWRKPYFRSPARRA